MRDWPWSNGPSAEQFYEVRGRDFRAYLDSLSDNEVLSTSEGELFARAEKLALFRIEVIEDEIRCREEKVERRFSDGFGGQIRRVQDALSMRIPFKKVPNVADLLQLGLKTWDTGGPPEGWDIDPRACVITLLVGAAPEQMKAGRAKADRWIGYLNQTVDAGRTQFLEGARRSIQARVEKARQSRTKMDELRRNSPYPIDEA